MNRGIYRKLIRKSIADLDCSLCDLQERHIRAALFLGYTREAIKYSGDRLLNYVNNARDDYDIPEVIDSSVSTLILIFLLFRHKL